MTPRPAGAGASRPAAGYGAADRHLLGADPVLARLIEQGGPLDPEDRRRGRPADPYGALLRSIVGQQLSTRAARTIYGRVAELFGGGTPTPRQLLDADPEAMRAAGLSRAKVAYMRDLAEQVESGKLPLERISEQPDEEVVAELTAVKGLGRWTAEMFLMFHLGRPDVLPVGDLGIRRAVEGAYGLEALPDAAELERIAEPWRPQRTLACLYLWRSLDNVPA